MSDEIRDSITQKQFTVKNRKEFKSLANYSINLDDSVLTDENEFFSVSKLRRIKKRRNVFNRAKNRPLSEEGTLNLLALHLAYKRNEFFPNKFRYNLSNLKCDTNII